MPIIDPFDTSIYALKDENGNILYVGKTVHPRQRFSQHIRGDTSGSGDIPEDVRMRMTMMILEKCSNEKGFEREAYWFNQLNPSYNKMRLINKEISHILEKESIPKKPEYRFFSVRAATRPKPEPKTICECGKTWSIEQKEHHLKQHREMSVQHLAWAAKPSNPC
jgi:excinuclease UvrABC nuclease subunit